VHELLRARNLALQAEANHLAGWLGEVGLEGGIRRIVSGLVKQPGDEQAHGIIQLFVKGAHQRIGIDHGVIGVAALLIGGVPLRQERAERL
jgi:hypothetical protein